jgi:hypothetical protein
MRNAKLYYRWQEFYPDEHFRLEYMQPFTNISEVLPSDEFGEVDGASGEIELLEVSGGGSSRS